MRKIYEGKIKGDAIVISAVDKDGNMTKYAKIKFDEYLFLFPIKIKIEEINHESIHEDNE